MPPQPRDLALFQALERWGVLGLGQIDALIFHTGLDEATRCALFFNEYGEALYRLSAYKRLSDLLASGHITKHHYRDFPMVFTLADKAHRELRGAGKARLPGFRRSISGHLVEHEVMVNGVGLALSQLQGLPVRTIRERLDWNPRGGWSHNTSRATIPDLWVAEPNSPKAIEIELHQKAGGLYTDLWNSYRRALPPNAAVLYLTDWPNGPDFILRHAERHSCRFVFVSDLDGFRRSAGRKPFVSHTGNTMTLGGAKPLISGEAACPQN